jgi:HAE1 family hydrophobic/amphiphilic exporter-1
MLAARWYRPGDHEEAPSRGFPAWFDRQYGKVEEVYRRLLGAALRRRGWVVAAGFGSLALMGLLSWQVIGFDFTPSIDRGEVNAQMELPPGASLEATDALMKQVEAAAATIPDVEQARMFASVGEIIGGFGSLPDRGAQFGQLRLMLREKQSFLERMLHPLGQPDRRSRSDEEVAADLRKRLSTIPGGDRVAVAAARGLTSNLAPVTLSLFGNDVAALQAASDELIRRMSKLPELRNVDSTMRRGQPELRVVVDRERMADSLATPAELAGVVRTAVAGNTDLTYRDGGTAYPIRLRVQRTDEEGRTLNAEDLSDLLVARRGPSSVYVGDIADVKMGAGPTKILRSHRVRRAVISAHVVEGVSLGAAQTSVDAVLAGMELGSVRAQWEGDVDDMKESAGLMAGAIILAIILSYMLMAALFNNMLQPLTIMASVPMALVGGLCGLVVTGMTMNIVAMIGIVMLIGLVSKNAILLVDYTNTLRAQGHSRNEALQAAGPVRLRPILMTTIATVCGMLPVAMQIGRASEMRSPMAVVVIGGLLLSTLLTLLVIPVMYTFFDDFGGALLRVWGRISPQGSANSASKSPASVPLGGKTDSAGAE